MCFMYVGMMMGHVGQCERWVWDWNGSVAPKQSGLLFIRSSGTNIRSYGFYLFGLMSLSLNFSGSQTPSSIFDNASEKTWSWIDPNWREIYPGNNFK